MNETKKSQEFKLSVDMKVRNAKSASQEFSSSDGAFVSDSKKVVLDAVELVPYPNRWFDNFESKNSAVFSCAVKLDKHNGLSVSEMKFALLEYLQEQGMNELSISNLTLYSTKSTVAGDGNYFKNNKFLSKESPCYYKGIYVFVYIIIIIIYLTLIYVIS